jgi:hypothetical protein
MHDDRAMKHELGDVTPRPSLGGFASSEKVLLPIPPLRWPSHHPAPNCGGVCSIHITSLLDHPNHSNCRLHLRPCRSLSPRRHLSSTLCSPPFKFYEESSLWLHSRPPLDHDDIVELDFSRTQPRSATSIHLSAGGRTARTFQEGPGEGAGDRTVAAPSRVVGCVDAGLSPAVLGRLSQAQAYTAQCVTRSGLAVSPFPSIGRCRGESAQPGIRARENARTII